MGSTDGGKWTFLIVTEKILKSIFSAVYLSIAKLLFSEVTQPVLRSQNVNKDLTPSVYGLVKSKQDFLKKFVIIRIVSRKRLKIQTLESNSKITQPQFK